MPKKVITLKSAATFIVYAAATIFLIYAFIKNYNKFSLQLFHFNIWFLLLAGITTVGFFVFRSLAWSRLLSLHLVSVSKISAAYYLSSSELIRYIPGNIWGLGARVLRGKNFSVPHDVATNSLVEETVSILSSGCLLGLVFIFFAGTSALYWVIALCLAIGAIGIFFFRNFFSIFKPLLTRTFRISFTDQFISTRMLLHMYPYHILMWLSFALAHVFLFLGISSLSVPFAAVMAFSLIGWVAGFVSLLTPSGLGVREVILALGISTFAPLSFSTAFSVAVRCWFIIIEVLFVVVTGMIHSKQKVASNTKILQYDPHDE